MAQNPFRSEADAYRFLLLTIGYFARLLHISWRGLDGWTLGLWAGPEHRHRSTVWISARRVCQRGQTTISESMPLRSPRLSHQIPGDALAGVALDVDGPAQGAARRTTSPPCQPYPVTEDLVCACRPSIRS